MPPPPDPTESILVVSGLPRSGTSLVMRVLAAGGVPVLTDQARAADPDNPHGYFEFEAVKRLAQDTAWLAQARGKAVKVVSPLLRHLPATYRYAVVFVRRDLGQILASQRAMLARQGGATVGEEDGELAAAFRSHLTDVAAWLAGQSHMDVFYAEHSTLNDDPAAAVAALDRFLGGRLDRPAAAAVVDPLLYRQRDL